jgi:hypothetical protein
MKAIVEERKLLEGANGRIELMDEVKDEKKSLSLSLFQLLTSSSRCLVTTTTSTENIASHRTFSSQFNLMLSKNIHLNFSDLSRSPALRIAVQ